MKHFSIFILALVSFAALAGKLEDNRSMYRIGCVVAAAPDQHPQYFIHRYQAMKDDGTLEEVLTMERQKPEAQIEKSFLRFAHSHVPVTHNGFLIYTQPVVDERGKDRGYLHVYRVRDTSILDIHVHGPGGLQTGILTNYTCRMTR